MTDLEKAIVHALRLSDEAAEKLLQEIQRNVNVARAELQRSGVPADIAGGSGALVEDAIITFCLIKMGSEEERDRNETAFKYQQDNLRKSKNEE